MMKRITIMKVKLTVSNSMVETKRYVDQKTDNARDRVIATVGGETCDGEMMTCVVYGEEPDDFKTLSIIGSVIVAALAIWAWPKIARWGKSEEIFNENIASIH